MAMEALQREYLSRAGNNRMTYTRAKPERGRRIRNVEILNRGKAIRYILGLVRQITQCRNNSMMAVFLKGRRKSGLI